MAFNMKFHKSRREEQRTQRNPGSLGEGEIKGRKRLSLLNIKSILKAMGLTANTPVGQNREPSRYVNLIYARKWCCGSVDDHTVFQSRKSINNA